MASLILLLSATACAAGGDIPDAATMLREVSTHQRELDAIRDNYTFHRLRRTEEVDASGRVTKTETVELEIFSVNGRPIRRILKRNGVPLSEHEQKAQDANVRKAVEAAIKQPPASGPSPARATLVSDILAMSKISNPRRLDLNGRSTLTYEFKGDPGARAKTMEQNAARKLSGTIWFDEKDRQVAQLEIQLNENFKVGGGLLASVQKGAALKLSQSPVGDGLWMQTSNEEHLNARFLMMKGVHQNIRVEDSDFRKFDVATAQKIGAPSR
jgi:hypothetical protein